MNNRHIIFVPGKNPKPPPEQHRQLLWRTLLEGVRRSEPELVDSISTHADGFTLVAWNHLYYRQYRDISDGLPWIDALINKHGPTPQDILDSGNWQHRLAKILFSSGDMFPFVIPLLPKTIRHIAIETRRYFSNADNVACDIRELLSSNFDPCCQAVTKCC